MKDRDTWHYHEDNYEQLLNFIKTDPKIGVAGLFAKGSVPYHVRMCCLVIRLEAIKNFRFHIDNIRTTCTCFAMHKDMQKNEWGCVYYKPGEVLCEEI